MIPPSSWLKISHRTAIVTGAASGIGAAVSSALVKEHGCRHVILVDRHAENLQEMILKQENNTASSFTHISCDVGNETQVQSMMQEAFLRKHHKAPSPSILINCAGITRDSLVTKMTLEQWNDVLKVNLTGTFLTCREFVRLHQETAILDNHNPPASIVNVGSVVAKYGNVGQANYAASKGGVVGLTKALAKETATSGIRVNAVLPVSFDRSHLYSHCTID